MQPSVHYHGREALVDCQVAKGFSMATSTPSNTAYLVFNYEAY